MNNLKEKIKNTVSSMRFTMIATYFGVILITLALMCVYIIGLLSDNLYSDESVTMFAKANIISQTLGDVWSNDLMEITEKFDRRVENCLAGTNIRGVVVNTSYTVLYDTNKESEMRGKIFMRDILKRALDGEQAQITSDTETGSKMISVAVPVGNGEEIIGGVYLAESVDSIASTVKSIRTSLIFFSALIVILIGMLSLGMSYVITSPLEEFRQVAGAISKGDFSKRVTVRGHNEMAQMGETLNYMCNELNLLEEKRRKFVSDASHELKTPMAGIKLICDSLVAAENPDIEMVKEFLGDMSDEVDRLTRIVERLLTLTRLDNGNSDLKLEETDIKSMLNQIVKKLSSIAQAKDIILYTDYSYNANEALLIDYDKIYEALYNIIDNAIKYSPEGGYVHVDVHSDSGNMIIMIEDNGPGIPEEERERIFERFYRLDDSRARDTGGTGLGLSITKEAILMHGGSVEVQQAASGGSIFIVKLPMNASQEVHL